MSDAELALGIGKLFVIFIATFMGATAIVGSVAFWRAGAETASVLRIAAENGNVLRLLTVLCIVVAAALLALLGKISPEAVTAILSGIAGFSADSEDLSAKFRLHWSNSVTPRALLSRRKRGTRQPWDMLSGNSGPQGARSGTAANRLGLNAPSDHLLADCPRFARAACAARRRPHTPNTPRRAASYLRAARQVVHTGWRSCSFGRGRHRRVRSAPWEPAQICTGTLNQRLTSRRFLRAFTATARSGARSYLGCRSPA
jgi:hypothetical protein